MALIQPDLEMLASLLLSAIFGGLIGLERESHHRPAGLRTNMLVCVGACMFSLISTYGFASPDQSSRIIANVLVGVGFLGAGAVMKDEMSVHGLTTAATIWTVAALGVAIALKMYFLAGSAEVIILFTLFFVRRFEKHYMPAPPESQPYDEAQRHTG